MPLPNLLTFAILATTQNQMEKNTMDIKARIEEACKQLTSDRRLMECRLVNDMLHIGERK